MLDTRRSEDILVIDDDIDLELLISDVSRILLFVSVFTITYLPVMEGGKAIV